MKIRVPATSANLGPGFDSCGVALNKYLFVEDLGENHHWEISHRLGEAIPSDESNLLVSTALKVAPDLAPRKLKVTSDIPLARGLGSSSSVIVAGIELANRLAGLNLSEAEKIKTATELEGHPDNVAPAVTGDFTVASYVDGEVNQVKHYFPECAFIAMIPDRELLTEASRQVLPKELRYSEAVAASAIANVMVSAVVKGNLPLAGEMMEKDRWHEKYRSKLVPQLAEIRALSRQAGGYGCYLSGAGPTVMTLVPEEKAEKIAALLKKQYPEATVEIMTVDREGVQVF